MARENWQRLSREIRRKASPKKAHILQSFFKTGPGQYGEGDIFLGVTVPDLRKLAKIYSEKLDLPGLRQLIKSKFHEERLAALIILAIKYKSAAEAEKEPIFKFYLKYIKHINNWDLVDLSAPHIVGAHLFNREKSLLFKLARSQSLWEKRIAILATLYFINRKRPDETLKICAMLLKDPHDLIHKATGWMLREVGKKCSQGTEEKFLRKHRLAMPRTMLRYAIERFDQNKRRRYLSKS